MANGTDAEAAACGTCHGRPFIVMQPGTIIFLCFSFAAGVLAVLVTMYEFRRKRFEPEPTEDRLFRCGDCRYVYTDDPDVDQSRCPECGRFNTPFVF